jgi:hypothetical protein
MSAQDSQPAFPVTRHETGMTLRDYFATHATEGDMNGQREILREQLRRAGGIGVLPDDWRATARYMHADAMLKARQA